mmetsp:Transcript_529/g.1462  ORF Transcript_529/g.1462 Transcript_529/m.1462 type:complete len:207 (-) Transcript_529:852-1472(-)
MNLIMVPPPPSLGNPRICYCRHQSSDAKHINTCLHICMYISPNFNISQRGFQGVSMNRVWRPPQRPAVTHMCRVSTPATQPLSSVTGTKLTRRLPSVMTVMASMAIMSDGTVIGVRCMTSLTGSSSVSSPRVCSVRRRSPSVKVPSRRFSSSVTTVQPRALPDSSSSTSTTLSSGLTTGRSRPHAIMSFTCSMSCLPRLPAGWFIA